MVYICIPMYLNAVCGLTFYRILPMICSLAFLALDLIECLICMFKCHPLMCGYSAHRTNWSFAVTISFWCFPNS